jgi:hypothetical protein
MTEQDRSSRANIIQTVQTPLGFFVLVVLVVEIILGVLASSSEGGERTYLVLGMLGLIFLLVIIVALLAAFRPGALQGTQPVVVAQAQPTPSPQPGKPEKPTEAQPAAPRETSKPLGFPAQNRAGILVDLSHGQNKWQAGSVYDLAGDTLIRMIVPAPEEIPWHIQTVQDSLQLCSSDLARWRGMLLGIPYHQQIDPIVRDAVADWVRAGGRLALLGFELSDRHHKTNLNALAGEFGLRFNTDIVAPKGWKPANAKPYGAPVEFEDVNTGRHPLLEGIEYLRFQNLCTLTIDPGAQVLLTVGDHGIGWLKPETAKYVDGALESGRQEYEVIDEASWVPLIAEAPAGLTGAGKVLAIGTWDLLGSGYALTEDTDNLRFLRNLLAWLGS